MRLNDNLVTSFVYDQKEYNINLAFDVVLDAFDVLADDTLRDHEKAEVCLGFLLNESLEGLEAIELWNYIYEEFIEMKQEKRVEYDLQGNPMPTKDEDDGKRLFDFEKDASHIYASFRQAYGINLFDEQGKMHWHEFRSLFQGLPSDTSMKWIMRIRAWEPSKGESKEYKQQMRELQKEYALDDPEEVE
ncbi:bacteriophage Gp15 family protein [Virgibacillus kimchii]